ncbi:MAG TPA: hypothetical protein VJR89_20500 [Polyangiales bacterium]|nr:hypothetical protein [Polyangiales bacterium]
MRHTDRTWWNRGRGFLPALLLIGACGGDAGADNAIGAPFAGGAAPAVPNPPSGVAGSAPGTMTGVITPPPNMMTQPPPTTGATQPPPAGGVPCEVATVVSKNCTLCHAASARFGAPMPLMTLADFHADSKSVVGKKVYEVTPERINATDIKRRMPPASSSEVPAGDLAMFTTWLQGGAKAGANACAITDPMATGGDVKQPAAGSGGTMMPVTGMPGRMGHASIEPIEYNDPDMKCYKFLAHAQGDMNKPYMKSPGQQYINFGFKAPWTGTMYSRAIKLAIDPNSKVIHHWLLFKTGSVSDGSIAPGSGTHGSQDELLHGWAPGASPIYLDPDLGIKLDGGSNFLLEVHYYNDTGSSQPDMSGAEICVTPKKPTNEVALSWVGTDSIAGTSAQGTCTPRSQEPIHIIAAQPHMHLKGTRMKVVVNRKGGMKETIHDMPFDFEYQRYYVLDVTLMPGDTMTTSCTYSAPSTFGSATENEMCYFFSLHWPGGALASGSALPVHGQNACLL